MSFSCFYHPDEDGVFVPTEATASPWDLSAQHGGPPTALLAHVLETTYPRDDAIVARVAADFLGTIPRVPLRGRVRIVRPGSRIELAEATLCDPRDERPYVTARFWRIRVTSLDAEGVTPPRLPPPLPQEQERHGFVDIPHAPYLDAIEWRFVRGDLRTLGPAHVWARLRVPLVDGIPASPLSRVLVVVDSANGLSVELPMQAYLSIPPGLAVTLGRYPDGEWVYLEAQSILTRQGTGFARAEIADESGVFGGAEQPLLVHPR